MPSDNNRRLVFILIGLLVTLCSVAAFLIVTIYSDVLTESSNAVQREYPSTEDKQIFTTFWKTELQNNTADAVAYSFYSNAYVEARADEKHTAAHWFGSVLYEEFGFDGLEYCSSEYSFGCYHELVGLIILDSGISSVQELDEFCDSHTGCQHGIGHGLVSYYGYTDENLLAALAVCEELVVLDPVGGCLGGVFMEYNLRTMLAYDGVPNRTRSAVTTADVECRSDNVPDSAIAGCYFWLAQWAIVTAEGTIREKYAGAAAFCSTADRESDRLTCYKGLGYEASFYTQSPDMAGQFCDSARGVADPMFLVQCLSAAAAGLAILDSSLPTLTDLCTQLIGEQRAYCIASAHHLRMSRIENFDPNLDKVY